MENIQEEESIEIDLRITEGTQKDQSYECETKEPLKKYIDIFIKDLNLNYPSYIILYGGRSLFNEDLKKLISKIIKKIDKENKKMALLLYGNSDFDIHEKMKLKLF